MFISLVLLHIKDVRAIIWSVRLKSSGSMNLHYVIFDCLALLKITEVEIDAS